MDTYHSGTLSSIFKTTFIAVLSQYPDSDLIVISDMFSDAKLKLDVDSKVKSKIVRPGPASSTFLLHWKSSREGHTLNVLSLLT